MHLISSVQSFTVTAGQNTALSVSDTPTNDPVRISINKVDSETGDKVQGGASLRMLSLLLNTMQAITMQAIFRQMPHVLGL